MRFKGDAAKKRPPGKGACSAAFKSAGTLGGGGGVGPCARYGLEVRQFGSSASGPATTRHHVGVFVPAGSRTPGANKHRSHCGGWRMREHVHSRSDASQERERCLLTWRPRRSRRQGQNEAAARSRSRAHPHSGADNTMQWIYGTYETGNAISRTVVRDVCLGRSRTRLNPIATIRGENAFRPLAKGGCPALDEEVRRLVSFKSLHRHRRATCRQRWCGGTDGRRGNGRARRGLRRHRLRLCCAPRHGRWKRRGLSRRDAARARRMPSGVCAMHSLRSPQPPRIRNRRTRGVADDCAGDDTDRSQDQPGRRTQRRVADAFLRARTHRRQQ